MTKPEPPRDTMTPIQIPAGEIDGFLRSAETEFALGANQFTTRGAWAFPDADYTMLRGRSGIVGAGVRWTTLALENTADAVAGSPCTYYHLLTGGSRTGGAAGTSVEGITLNAGATKPVKALQIWAGAARVQSVRVLNLGGSRAILEGEGFGILVNDSPQAEVGGGSLIQNCHVEVVPGAYACGIYLGTVLRGERPLLRSEVRRCSVVSPSTAKDRAHCGYGINSRTSIYKCESHGMARAFFSDTGAGTDAEIRDCFVSGCQIGIEFRSSQRSWMRQRLEVSGTTFICEAGSGGYVAGVVLADDSKGENPVMGDIQLTGCVFVNASGQPGHVGSSNGPAFEPVTFRDCLFRGAWDVKQAKAAGWKFLGNTRFVDDPRT